MSLQPITHDPDATRHPNPGGARPVDRIDDVLDALRVYWRAHPDLRLGQIVSNLAHPVDARFVEDHYLLDRLTAPAPTKSGRRVASYWVRTAQRSARRLHVWENVVTGDGPELRPLDQKVFSSTPLCRGAETVTFTAALFAVYAPHLFGDPLNASDVTCDRCWAAYTRLATPTDIPGSTP